MCRSFFSHLANIPIFVMMKRIFQGNYYKVFIVRMLYVFLLFTLARILFYIFNHDYFDVSPGHFFSILFYGLVFDLSAIIVCYLPFILFSFFPLRIRSEKKYQKFLLVLFTLSTAAAMAANLLDCEYFRFAGARTTADIFKVLGLGSDFITLLPQYINDFWYLFLIWAGLVFISIYFFIKTKVNRPENKKGKTLLFWYLRETIILAIISGMCIIGFRGGLQLRPISIMTAGQYTSVQNMAFVLNTPFTIIKTIGKTGVKKENYFDEKTLSEIYAPVHTYYKCNSGQKKLNVVIIILESFSKEYIGALNHDLDKGAYKGYTPFLDSLIDESLVFPNSFANGKRSIEGIPAVLAGIPALMNEAFITSAYAGNNFSSLASILKEQGYSSLFFHGGTNGTMGFSNFANSAGFDNYFGRDEYNNEKDFDGKWGIFDEPFLQYAARTIDNSRRPFVAGIFTLSSHHPYKVPAQYNNVFSDGPLPIFKSIRYADYSLKGFFETVSKKSWFDSTLFVITADHTSESMYPEYQTRCGMYEVPIIFYQHNSRLKGKNSAVTQQTDIMPSVLDYLNYSKRFFAYGESVFDTTTDHYAVNYANESYEIIMNDYALIFDGMNSVSLYDIRKDSLMEKNIISEKPAIKSEMEKKLKAIIQSYNNSLLKNTMKIN